MNQNDLYSEANCRRVADWLGERDDNNDAWFIGESYMPGTDLQYFLRKNTAVPQLIREALAREGLFVVQYNSGRDVFGNFVTGQLGLAKKGQRAALVSFTWNTETDPTARHALMEALVEWLGKENAE